jgi:hypothetical protein
MAVIPKELDEQIVNDPSKDYPILVTLKNEILPPLLLNKGKFVMANKIFSAKMTGSEIQKLKNETEIEAIEPDMEVGML